MKITKVISGGQTGADQGGLYAAHDVGIPTGGWAPKDWVTEIGPNPELMQFFGLKESSGDYSVRTRQNVDDADLTIIVAGGLSSGSLLTFNYCQRTGKPVYHVLPTELSIKIPDVIEMLLIYAPEQRDFVLNVAGNRESKSRGVFEQTRRLIKQFLQEFNK